MDETTVITANAASVLGASVLGAWSVPSFFWNYFLYMSFIIFLPGIYVSVRSIASPTKASNMKYGKDWINAVQGWLFGFKFDVRNNEVIEREEGSFIVIANHQSVFDVVTIANMWPRNCVILAKSSLLWMTGPFGLAVWLAGNVFINRSDRKAAIHTLDRAAEKIKEKNLRLWIYPEGTRNTDGTLLPFKKGAFHMAVKAQVPIIPVVISSYNNWLNFSQKSIISSQGREIIVEVLDPILTEGKTADDINGLVEQSYSKMNTTFHRISKEAQLRTKEKVEEGTKKLK